MRTSVILTTYNGEKFLIPLLDSLRGQTKKIDEVLVLDDCSSDSTQSIVRKYIAENELSGWKLICHEYNNGWMKNFKIGIQSCTGDIVFPCDQDDIWEKDKIEMMSSIMEANTDIWLLSSDYEPLYEDGGSKVDEFSVGSCDALVEVPQDKRFALHERPGCVMAIRRELIEATRNIWQDWYPHDAFLWTTATLLDHCYLLHKSLIKYRRHDNNASTGSQHIPKAQVSALKRGINLITWVKENYEISDSFSIILKDYITFAKLRIDLIEHRNVLNWFRLLKYKDFYRSNRQLFGDWYYILKGTIG